MLLHSESPLIYIQFLISVLRVLSDNQDLKAVWDALTQNSYTGKVGKSFWHHKAGNLEICDDNLEEQSFYPMKVLGLIWKHRVTK